MSRNSKLAPTEVFLSHSSRNAAFTSKLANVLFRHNVKTFFSKQHIRGAQEWHDELGAALKRCDWFLVVLSPQAVRSTWVKRELVYALQQPRYNERIIPVLYKNCDVEQFSWTLSGFQYVDFRPGFDEGCEQLFDIWKLKYRPLVHRLH